MQERKVLTTEQKNILDELVEVHALDASQISFEGENATPIFDYEAVCALSLKLTDIQDIDCQISERDTVDGIVSASCKITLPDGRTRTVEDSASLNESFADNKIIDTYRLAENVAQARAVRRGIRSVGVNLFRAHQEFVKTGQAATAHTNNNPRLTHYQEIHKLASKIGLIDGADKSKYEQFLAEKYDGRTSSADLDDLELHRLLVTFRAFERSLPKTSASAEAAA